MVKRLMEAAGNLSHRCNVLKTTGFSLWGAFIMAKRIGCVLALVLFLTACGSTPLTTAGAGGSTTPVTTVTPTAAASPTPGTTTSGPIIIATDQATYAPNATINVLLTNTLTIPIGAFDHQASCSIFTLETQVNGTWEALGASAQSVTYCTEGKATTLIVIPAGETYHAAITASALQNGAVFAAGQYRLRLSYTTNTTDSGPATANIIYSATFTIA